MKRVKTFSEDILLDERNNFTLKSVRDGKSIIRLYIPQKEIAKKLREFVDMKPDRLHLFWSQAPVMREICDDLLNDRSLTFFDKLNRLKIRCPFLYTYTFSNNNKQKEQNENNHTAIHI